ncbi:unnamed protein product [Sphagnum balticum]
MYAKCGSIEDAWRVSVHQQIIQSGLESDVFVGNSLVDMSQIIWSWQCPVLLLATGISVRMLNGRERERVQRNSQVAPGLK